VDITALLISFGPAAIAVIAAMVFVENGLLFPFLPGDSLVFAGAVLAAATGIPLIVVAGAAALAVIAGGEVGFFLGRRYGRRWFRPSSRILKPAYLDETTRFFARWGRLAVVMGRFVPIVRTYISPAAGASTMRHATFTVWNTAAAIIWAGALGAAGALLGTIPWVAGNIEWLALGVIVVSVVPVLVGLIARRRKNRLRESCEPHA